MAKVKIFCDCGKEIWQELQSYQKKHMSLSKVEENAICSDCFLSQRSETRARELLLSSDKFPD